MRRRVIVSFVACALVVVALLACGEDELCDAQCVDGHLEQICCKSGSICAEPAAFCDLGGGRCIKGSCTGPVDANASQ
jgi:hypothetical protein